MNKPGRLTARPLSQLVGETIADALKRQGFARTGLITHWAEIVGPEIAKHAEPIRLVWPRAVREEEADPATLVLRVEGPVALEIQHLSGVIIERVNRFFGWAAVGKIAIRQAPLARRPANRVRGAPDAAAVARIAAGLPEIADDGLRAALARLGAAVKRT